MHKKLTSIVLFAVLMVSLAAATTTVSAASATEGALYQSHWAVEVGSPVLLYGYVHTTSGTPISGLPVKLQEYSGGKWTDTGKTLTTTSDYYNVNFNFPITTAGSHSYRAVFAGTTQYASWTSKQLVVWAGKATTLTILDASKFNVHVGQPFQIYAQLKDKSGAGINGQTVRLYRFEAGVWKDTGKTAVTKTAQPGAGFCGFYGITEPHAGQGGRYRVQFDGGGGYTPSQGAVTIDVQKAATTITVQAPQTAPWGVGYTVSGTLKDVYGHTLAYQSVTLREYDYATGKEIPIVVATQADGSYGVSLSKPPQAKYAYSAFYKGSSDYQGSQSSAWTTVTIVKRDVRITLVGNTGGAASIHGQLTDSISGHGLANRHVGIGIRPATWGGSGGTTLWLTTYPDGQFYSQWRPGWRDTHIYWCQAEFAGDVWYNLGDSAVELIHIG